MVVFRDTWEEHLECMRALFNGVKFGVRVGLNADAGRQCSMDKKPFYWDEQGKNAKRSVQRKKTGKSQ